MSYSVCRSGGKMCDGCMACYKYYDDEDLEYEEEVYEDDEEEYEDAE